MSSGDGELPGHDDRAVAAGDRTALPGLGEKPTIAEVAAWLRHAAEERQRAAAATAPEAAATADGDGREQAAEPQARPDPERADEPESDPAQGPTVVQGSEAAPEQQPDPEADREPVGEQVDETTAQPGDAPRNQAGPDPDPDPDPEVEQVAAADSSVPGDDDAPPPAAQAQEPAQEPALEQAATTATADVDERPPGHVDLTDGPPPGEAVVADGAVAGAAVYADLDALEQELATAPTPVVEQEQEPEPEPEPEPEVAEDRDLLVPKVGLFSLPDEVPEAPVAPVVLGVPAITLTPEPGPQPEPAVAEPVIEVLADDPAPAAFDIDAEEPEGSGGGVAETAKKPRRRAPRPRYPRGQLKERIGFFARLRAIVGITVVAVLLGVVLAGLIGGTLVFVFLAGRNAVGG